MLLRKKNCSFFKNSLPVPSIKMKYCCVPGCKETGGFKFPKDPVQRKKWQVAIRRQDTKKQLWKPTNHSVVCHNHFKTDDFKQSPFERLRKDLIPGAIPSVFHFNNHTSSSQSKAREERIAKRQDVTEKQNKIEIKDLSAQKKIKETNSEPIFLDDIEVFMQVDVVGKFFFLN